MIVNYMPVAYGSLKVNILIIFLYTLNISSISLVLVLVFWTSKSMSLYIFPKFWKQNEEAATRGVLKKAVLKKKTFAICKHNIYMETPVLESLFNEL